jgi:hypothetical protein
MGEERESSLSMVKKRYKELAIIRNSGDATI